MGANKNDLPAFDARAAVEAEKTTVLMTTRCYVQIKDFNVFLIVFSWQLSHTLNRLNVVRRKCRKKTFIDLRYFRAFRSAKQAPAGF